MKFIKKAAALFFCAALALSVMAISASADGVSDTSDPTFTVTLKETTTAHYGADVDGDGANEYATGDDISYDIYVKTATETLHVESFQFEVAFGQETNHATLAVKKDNNTPVVSSVSPLTNPLFNAESHKYSFSTPGTTDLTGLEVGPSSSEGTKIASITFTISGNSEQTQTFQLKNFEIKANEKAVAFKPSDPATVTVEVDPEYTITLKNPAVKDTNAIDYSTNNAPNYNVTVTSSATGVAPAYTAPANYSVLNDGTVTAPALNDYYTFKHYVVATGSDGNWRVGDVYSPEALTTALKGVNQANGRRTKHGNLVLNVVYTPNQYTVTIVNPTPDANTGAISYKSNASPPYSQYADGFSSTSSQHTTYTIEGFTTADRSATPSPIINNLTHTAYDFKYYAVTKTADAEGAAITPAPNWPTTLVLTSEETNPTNLLPYSIIEGAYGNVTLTAMFAPITYTATYALEDNAKMKVSETDYTDDSQYVLNYTINDAAVANANFNVAIPTRTGYTFKGWTATQSSAANAKTIGIIEGSETATAWPTEIPTDAEDVPIVPMLGKYGDVVLTANWAINGHFAKTEYSYTKDTNNLLLFAARSDQAGSGGYYTYDNKPMFEVNEKYKAVFKEGNGDALETLPNGVTWTIYAYIGASNAANISKVAYVNKPDGDTNSNVKINYQGKVTSGNNTVGAGDYGNVVAILANSAYTNSQLNEDTQDGIRARLEADIDVVKSNNQPNMNSEIAGSFGNINDVIAIMKIALGITT